MRLEILFETRDDEFKRFMDFSMPDNKKTYRMTRNTGETYHPGLPEPRQVPMHRFDADNVEHALYLAKNWLMNNDWKVIRAKTNDKSMMTGNQSMEIYAVPTPRNELYKEFVNMKRRRLVQPSFTYQIWVNKIDEYDQLQKDYLSNRYGFPS